MLLHRQLFPSLIGVLLASLHNPNLCWDASSQLVALAEVEVIAMTSQLIGYDPEQSSGVVYLWWHREQRSMA